MSFDANPQPTPERQAEIERAAHSAPPAAPPPEAPTRAEVECAECAQAFIPHPAEHPMGAAVILSFACPHCGREHPYALLSKRGVALRKRLTGALEYDPDRIGQNVNPRPLSKALRREWRQLDPSTDHTLLTPAAGDREA